MQLFGLLVSVADAASIPLNSQSDSALGNGVMHFPLFRDHGCPGARLVKRDDGSFSISLNNTVSYFSTVLSIGSDNQNVVVQVDTGSSDLWVMDSSNPYCKSVDGQSTNYGVSSDMQIDCTSDTMFDHTKSTTFNENSTAFSIQYGDGSFANGTYCYDTVSLGGNSIQNAHFAIAEYASSAQDVWGIGLVGSEATVTTINLDGSFSEVYDNIPIQMKQQGLIQANAYSLFLNDFSATEGSLLFGGVDHSKYTGTLQTLPLISQYRRSRPNSFYVTFNGLSAYNKKNKFAQIADAFFPVLLDSGSSLTYLPTTLVTAIASSVGAQYSSDGYLVMDCNASGGLQFNLGGILIDVDFSQMLFPTNYRSLCILGIVPSTSSPYILGDSFLRSAYVVYDLDNYELAIAQASYDNSDEQIEVISDSIPSASQAPSYSETTGTNFISTTLATVYTEAVSVTSGADIENTVAGNPGPTHTATAAGSSGTSSASSSRTTSTRSSNDAVSPAPPKSGVLSAVLAVAGFFMLI